ncbi:response regulator transcription factor [Snuella lapsa]|uniref:Response regulator transcription factor n=1 Tax=Snuella lapsa TaxID=870481 RepID=A0ABP6WUV8_9FLAO
MDKLKVLIADDHYIVRLGLKILVDSFEGFKVVMEAENGQDVIDQVECADYFILDLEMPVVNGIRALEHIKTRHPEKRVVLLTNSMDIPTLIRAKNLKPNGFLFKDGMHEEIKICLNELKKGNYYWGRNCRAFFERHESDIVDTEHLMENLKDLTKTEIKILFKISENLSTQEIAEALFNSPKTIDNHRTNIAKKLDISGYNNLQAIAIKNKSLVESLYNSVFNK